MYCMYSTVYLLKRRQEREKGRPSFDRQSGSPGTPQYLDLPLECDSALDLLKGDK